MSVCVCLEWQALVCAFREQTQHLPREQLGLLRPELAAAPSPVPPCPALLSQWRPLLDSEMCVVALRVGWGRPLGASAWQTACLGATGMGGTLQKGDPNDPQSREGPG